MLIQRIKAEAAFHEAKRRAELEEAEELRKRGKLEERKRMREERRGAVMVGGRRRQPGRKVKLMRRYGR